MTSDSRHVLFVTMMTTKNCCCRVMGAILIIIPTASASINSLEGIGFAIIVLLTGQLKASTLAEPLVGRTGLPIVAPVPSSAVTGLDYKLRTPDGLVFGNLSGTV